MSDTRYFLAPGCYLKLMETPCLYRVDSDDLYEVDDTAFEFLAGAASKGGVLSGGSEFVDFCLDEGILRRTPQGDTPQGRTPQGEPGEAGEPPPEDRPKQPTVGQSPLPSLRYLELQITDECNLSCRHCYIESARCNRMALSQICAVLGEFEDMQGLRVLITGGEPTIHPDFLSLNDMLPRFCLRKLLFTNGLSLNDHLLDALNVDEIIISLDGLQDGHEALRGAGTFSRTLKAIETSVKKGFATSVSTMVHALNVNDFDHMQQMFTDMGVKDWTVDIAAVAGNFRQHPSLKVSPTIGGRLLNYGFGGGIHAGHDEFACGYHLMSVLADGRAAKCAFYADQSVGNVRDGLLNCWQRVKPIPLSGLKCNDCQEKLICRGGCRYRAASFGDPLGKDFYRCQKEKT
ncbi:radical SAM domain-containing protein [Candidatus Magnetobacterium bavaricum]|uniref:Radical SAM domain-containing protein n=1 Tax=Candidatus Magnetobacterium bavaricum TaxID=29290 RepID=A0A0F3GSU9_9BACT|nr:radical SAM domain-containing protein [Candidatus Magnetobacterium bavaricum]